LAEASLNSFLDNVKNIRSKVGTPCTQCGQVITEESIKKHYDEARLMGEEARFRDAVKEALVELENEKAKVETSKIQRVKLEAEIEEYRKGMEDIRAALERQYSELDIRYALEREPIENEKRGVEAEITSLARFYDSEVQKVEATKKVTMLEFDTKLANLDTEFEKFRADKNVGIFGYDNLIQEDRNKCNSEILTIDSEISGHWQRNKQVRGEIASIDVSVATLTSMDVYSKVRALKETLTSVEAKQVGVEKSLLAVQDDEAVYDYLTIAFGTTGIRSLMMDSVLNFMNLRLKEHCKYLFDGQVNVELNPTYENKNGSVVDKLNLVVTTQGGNYESASGGERRKVDIALFMAFRDLNRMVNPLHTNMEAYDEILANLDSEAAGKVINMLDDDGSVGTRFLITHRTDITIEGHHNILQATKKNGMTTYKEL
jgi:hypothetical protein